VLHRCGRTIFFWLSLLFFETQSCCGAQADLEFTIAFLSLLCAGITGMYHHTQCVKTAFSGGLRPAGEAIHLVRLSGDFLGPLKRVATLSMT
jgi:hypothetical protein